MKLEYRTVYKVIGFRGLRIGLYVISKKCSNRGSHHRHTHLINLIDPI